MRRECLVVEFGCKRPRSFDDLRCQFRDGLKVATHSDPDHLRPSCVWETADLGQTQFHRTATDASQRSGQTPQPVFRDIPEESKGDVQLLRLYKPHTLAGERTYQ